MSQWAPEDLMYTAGYLDGEGCFYAHQYKSLLYGVACENTHKPTVEWLRDTFGGTVHVMKPKKDNHRVTYRWTLAGKKSVPFCQAIAAYLKEKRFQALLIIAVGQTTHLDEGRTFSPETKELRQQLVDSMKELKHVSW